MFTTTVLWFSSSWNALGQYPRVWSTPPSGSYFSMQYGGTNFAPLPFFPFDPLEVPLYDLGGTPLTP